jgi:LPXTG-site transpeptidase (sortase) family protein
MRFFWVFIIFFIFLFLYSPVFAYEIGLPPERIIIPSINISLPVQTAQITKDTWEVYYKSASFGDKTTYPGHNGNTVIFAHALPMLFKKLPEIQNGEIIHIFTSNNWYEYIVIETKTVRPESTEILQNDNEFELTLFTCVGTNFENRFVVKAVLKNSL